VAVDGHAKPPSESTIGGSRRIGDVRQGQKVSHSDFLICGLLRWGQPYMDKGAEAYEMRIGSCASKAWQLRPKNGAVRLTVTA
jgi:hypothetical protein